MPRTHRPPSDTKRGLLPDVDSNIGKHNSNLEASRGRLIRGATYQDCSTICVIPTRGIVSMRVVLSWWGLVSAMNQKFFRLPVEKMEVADAYNKAIEDILAHPDLSTWKYVLTLEEDNCPAPDGLLKLYEGMDKYDVIGGLYWTKGDGGQPMIYGDPTVFPKNYIPQVPIPNSLQPCNGLGMGFTLFKLDMFKKIPRPWFKTVQEYTPGKGVNLGTQDLYFFDNAAKAGYRFACDTRVLVGHWDQQNGVMW